MSKDQLIIDLHAIMRSIYQITPDFDGEDEDGERLELHQCLETAKRLARRGLDEVSKYKKAAP